jgi:hypothetical protein
VPPLMTATRSLASRLSSAASARESVASDGASEKPAAQLSHRVAPASFGLKCVPCGSVYIPGVPFINLPMAPDVIVPVKYSLFLIPYSRHFLNPCVQQIRPNVTVRGRAHAVGPCSKLRRGVTHWLWRRCSVRARCTSIQVPQP